MKSLVAFHNMIQGCFYPQESGNTTAKLTESAKSGAGVKGKMEGKRGQEGRAVVRK